MYFVFQNEFLSWRNQDLIAELYNFGVYRGKGTSRTFLPVPEVEPHWWLAQPLVTPLPELHFSINPYAPLLDNFETGTEFDLYSARLVELIRGAGVSFETFPAKLVDRNTGVRLPLKYEVFHLLESYPVLDMERSEIGDLEIRKLVVTEAVHSLGRPLFRIQEQFHLTLIHESLKTAFEQAGITGCKYIPLERYQVLRGVW